MNSPDGAPPATADTFGGAAEAGSAPSGVHYTVGTAAHVLSDRIQRQINRKALFAHLVTAGWVTRRHTGYIPTLTALAEDYVDLVPAATPAGIWDQLVITPTGLDQLAADLRTA